MGTHMDSLQDIDKKFIADKFQVETRYGDEEAWSMQVDYDFYIYIHWSDNENTWVVELIKQDAWEWQDDIVIDSWGLYRKSDKCLVHVVCELLLRWSKSMVDIVQKAQTIVSDGMERMKSLIQEDENEKGENN